MFIGSPEKALCDLAYFQNLSTEKLALEYLLLDLRIEESNLKSLDKKLLLKISDAYKLESVRNLVNAIKGL